MATTEITPNLRAKEQRVRYRQIRNLAHAFKRQILHAHLGIVSPQIEIISIVEPHCKDGRPCGVVDVWQMYYRDKEGRTCSTRLEELHGVPPEADGFISMTFQGPTRSMTFNRFGDREDR